MQALRARERCWQQDVVDDVPHEERFDHVESGCNYGEDEYGRDFVAVRFEPAQVFTNVLTTRLRFRRALVVLCDATGRERFSVECTLVIAVYKKAVSPARGPGRLFGHG